MKLRPILFILVLVGLLAGLIAAISVASAGTTQARRGATADTTDVIDWQDHGGVLVMNPQVRGTSDLVRTVEDISMNISTTDLPVGAYSVWYIVFNNPRACSDRECGENDVLPPNVNPDAEVSAVWATGGIVGPDRGGHFSSSLGVGLDAAPGQVLWGDALTNPMGAEIHLIIRYHGSAIWGDSDAFLGQLATFQGNCTPASSFDIGTDVNAFACYEPYMTSHLP